MTIIPIIINGKFLMIAAPKKQINLLTYSAHLFPTISCYKIKRCGNVLSYLILRLSHCLWYG